MTARSVRDSTWLAVALALAFGAIYAAIARLALDAFPYSGDEYSLALQGELFARGVLKAQAPEHIEWFRIDHVVIDAWVRSKYPPGGPALLSLGARAGLAWLVTPIEGCATLVVVWHTTRRLLGARPALVALIALGIAPLFAFNAASFYAHTPATLFLAIAFAGVAAWDASQRRRLGWLVLAGAAIGCCFLIRPLDALLFGVAMVVFRSPRAVLVTAASALPFVALNLVYQNAQFGSPLSDGYAAYAPILRELYGPDLAASQISLGNIVSPLQWWNHLDVFRALSVDWTIPGTVLVALVGGFAIGRDHPARAMRTFSIALIAIFSIVLLATIADPDDGARPRYLSTTLIPIAVLAAAGFGPTCAALEARFGRRIRTILVTLAVVFSLAQLAAFLQERIPRVWKREGLFAAVDHQHLSRAIVIVRAQYPSRYARNGPWFDGGVLYVSAPATTRSDAIAAAFPDREIWEAHDGEPWTLARIR